MNNADVNSAAVNSDAVNGAAVAEIRAFGPLTVAGRTVPRPRERTMLAETKRRVDPMYTIRSNRPVL